MTQEEKQLSLKDLSARLPYGVKILYEGQVKEIQYIEPLYNELKLLGNDSNYTIGIEEIKPYLRPMSSMTEKEKKEFDDFCVIDEEAWMKKSITGFINQSIIMSNGIDWLNAHHFDYRGLIPKGLALPAPEGMYN